LERLSGRLEPPGYISAAACLVSCLFPDTGMPRVVLNRKKEITVTTSTLLIILVVVLLVGGGGWGWSRRSR
jgi:hypothetical protein